MNKKEIFKNELEYIKNENYRKSAENLLKQVPDYFFIVPASSTGKYHPSFSQGEKGLVRHTKVAMKIANDLLGLEYTDSLFTEKEKDLLLISILFHDCQKLGNPQERYTRFDHPLLAGKFIKENQNKTTLNDEEIEFIVKTISNHMGEWNTNSYTSITLPKPSNKYEFFVHACDYLSSKKYLDVKFDENSNIIL
ncbi:MAG: HD domain-containing protein [Bacilli bacterium]